MSDYIPSPDQAIRGLPGTGKTATLLDRLEAELADREVTDIAVSTFRNSMAAEFKTRARREVTGDLPDDNWFRTTHSSCFQLLPFNSEDVVTDSDRARVCEEVGVDFSGVKDADPTAADIESATGGKELGNILFSIHSYCRNIRSPTEEAWRECPTVPDGERPTLGRNGGALVRRFVEEYEGYKAANGKIDFDGMLEEVVSRGLVPPTTVLIEDEFQDKSRLQVEVSNLWCNTAERVYVAGDPYQAIYRFMGTDPSHMERVLDNATRATTLDTSYRFGPELWEFATSILDRAGYDVPSVEPVGETNVESIDQAEYRRLCDTTRDDTALHLVRANYLAEQPAVALRDAGVPFDSRAGPRWTDRMINLYNAVSKMREVLLATADNFGVPDFGNLYLTEIEAVAWALRAEYHKGTKGSKNKETGNMGTIAEGTRTEINVPSLLDVGALRNDLTAPDPFSPNLMTQTGVGSEAIRDRLRATWEARDGERIDDVTHMITTIHGSKGMEADHVFLFDALPPRVASEARPLPATDTDEARVFFVGATRASENLYLVNTQQPHRYPFPTIKTEGR